MKRPIAVILLIYGCFAGAAYSQTAGLPLWAYGYITPAATQVDYSAKCLGERPSDCDRPGGIPVDPSNTVRRLEGSDLTFTVAQINARFGPADWFPNDHPPMPDIVAHGKEAIGSRACSVCHLPNGKGLMQNGGVAGLPADYILQQLADFKSGKRHSADLNKANGFEMAAIARTLTDDEAKSAAGYFSAVTFTKWMRVVESATAPKFTASVNGLFLKEDGTETVPLGNRLVEMPENAYDTNILRNPRSGFVVYAPIGSLAKGESLTMTCSVCHGAGLQGLTLPRVGAVPPIAGRSASYLARALYDFKLGSRGGTNAQFMKPAVDKLTEDDVIAIAAYVASLEP
jgi:cytochrome c553